MKKNAIIYFECYKSEKECNFVCMSLLSVFLINIVYEIQGETRYYTLVSVLFKLILGLCFVGIIPDLLRRNARTWLLIGLISIVIVVFNYCVFEESRSYLFINAITFYLYDFTMLSVLSIIEDFELLREKLLKISYFICFCVLTIMFFDWFGVITFLNGNNYNMSIGYACLLPVLNLFTEVVEKHSIKAFVASVILVMGILLYASRGPLLGIVLFMLIYWCKYFYNKGEHATWCLSLFGLLFLSIFFQPIMKFFVGILAGVGIQSRTFTLLAEDILHSSGRNDIYEMFISLIKEEPFKVRGLFADRVLIGYYAHSIVIELFYEFGLVFGTLMLFSIFCGVIKTINDKQMNARGKICLMFMCASLPTLLISGSLWTQQEFWMWVALLFCGKNIANEDYIAADI